MLGALLTLFVAGIVGLVLLTVALTLIGVMFSVAFSIMGFLLFKVAPILLVGWLILKLLERRRPRPGLSAADRRWLDS